MRFLLTIISISALASCAWCEELEVSLGPAKLAVHVSETATVFYIVDQVSQWSEFCHGQYARYYKENGGLTEEEQALLHGHAELRRQHPWGEGIEQAFYTTSPLDAAFNAAVKTNCLTPSQAKTEREVLLHFLPRARSLLSQEAPVLNAFVARMKAEQDELVRYAAAFGRFCGCANIDIPVYLMPDPDDSNGGGGYNGGRLTIEICRKGDVYPTLLHEITHAFIDPQKDLLAKAVQGVDGLDVMALNEGLAYAFSPGILYAEKQGDPLAEEVQRDVADKKPMSDNYARFHRYGLALRPLLNDALIDPNATLAAFLPRCIDVWLGLNEVQKALNPKLIPMRFVIDDSMKKPDRTYGNPNIPQFLKAVEDQLRGTTFQPEEWIEIRITKGGKDARGTLNRNEQGNWVSVVGTESAMSESFIDFLQTTARHLGAGK